LRSPFGKEALVKSFNLVSTSGILGYGFPEASLEAAMARSPDMIGGSVDPGPHYLGSGKPFTSTMSIKRDLRLMLRAAIASKIPMVIGTCGGAGGEPHLELVAGLVRDIAREDGLHFRMAVIHAEQHKSYVTESLSRGRIKSLNGHAPLAQSTVDKAERIVGMMGPEPFMRALDQGAQVVLAGRSSDPASFAATIMRAQLPPAQAWYAGKMLECGATPSVPKGHDCLFVTVDQDSVTCEPTNPARKCTPLSVATHSLHENASPCFHVEPGGLLDTSDCRFEAVSDRAVRVSGMRWTPADQYTVKLEGVELAGYRALTVCGTRDPLLISRFDSFIDSVRSEVEKKAAAFGVKPEDYTLTFRCYGRDGVMADREPVKTIQSHEIGIVADVVAKQQDVASAVLGMARTNLLHTDFPGRLCREGNMAFPFSPSDIEAGPVYRFTFNHVVEVDDPCAMFPIDYETV
jgi:hypothetical protein